MELIITINPDGTSELEVIGGTGKSCTKLTRSFEEGLGKIQKRTFKPEYRQQQNYQTQHQNARS